MYKDRRNRGASHGPKFTTHDILNQALKNNKMPKKKKILLSLLLSLFQFPWELGGEEDNVLQSLQHQKRKLRPRHRGNLPQSSWYLGCEEPAPVPVPLGPKTYPCLSPALRFCHLCLSMESLIFSGSLFQTALRRSLPNWNVCPLSSVPD